MIPRIFVTAIVSMILAQTPPTRVTVTTPLLLAEVAISPTHVAFSYAGDLWQVPRGGGEAQRLTATPAMDAFPTFSPDGKWLAFVRAEADLDVYVMPAAGGEARRLTYFPKEDVPFGWTPDSKHILFLSTRDGDAHMRLYTIPLDGSLETPLPLPYAVQGSYSPDGRSLAYLPKSMSPAGFQRWRHYRGGQTSPLWIVRLNDLQIERLTDDSANARYPMWVGNRIYFLSDRSGAFNLYSYETSTKRTQPLTTFQNYGIDFAASTSDAIAFVRNGEIHVYDLKRGTDQTIPVSVSVEAPERQPRSFPVVSQIESADFVSRDQMVLGTRGDVVMFSPTTRESRVLIGGSKVAERYPRLSPDKKQLAYFSDESGEYELHVRSMTDPPTVRKIRIEERPSFYREPVWSPDSKNLALSDIRLALWVVDTSTGTARKIDESTYVAQGEYKPDWSPDGRYLTYAKALENRLRAAFIYDAKENRTRQVTDGLTHVESPVFDAGGRYLYFISSSNARLAGAADTEWELLSTTYARPLVTRSLNLLVLRSGDRAPFIRNLNRPDPQAVGTPLGEVAIDFGAGMERRIVQIPAGVRDYVDLERASGSGMYAVVREWGTTPLASPSTTALYKWDAAAPVRLEKVADNSIGLLVARDGSGIAYQSGGAPFIKLGTAEATRLDLTALRLQVDPAEEWQQMYREVWRQMRDTFYDPRHHGQNLAELERHYATYLPAITRRSDLNMLFFKMLGHISVSHLQVGGGDMSGSAPGGANPPAVGDIGADFEIVDGRYRFKKILRSPHFSSAVNLLSAPLDQPGVDIKEGDFLLAIDGQPVEITRNIYAYFAGKVNQPVQLRVASDSAGQQPRLYTVVPATGTGALHNQDRGETNRRRVDELSGGRLGYVYVGNYGQGGIDDFIRAVLGMSGKDGLIIDQRFNGGGTTADWLIEMLNRENLYHYAYRYGSGFPTPPVTFNGPKVLITNEQNFSAAETFAFMFKLTKTGTIVGARTGGGGIGSALFQPALIDGGRIAIPNRAAYNPAGSWDIENQGVLPDIPVELLPRDFRNGRDPQLERAVQVALEASRKSNPQINRRPPYPIHR